VASMPVVVLGSAETVAYFRNDLSGTPVLATDGNHGLPHPSDLPAIRDRPHGS